METDDLTIAVAQMCSSASLEENLITAENMVREAKRQDADLLVLPEYFPLMGQHESDKLALQETMGKGLIQQSLSRWARENGLWIVAGSMPICSDESDRPFGRTLVFNRSGKCVSHYDKIHLFDVDVADSQKSYRESKATKPGKTPRVVETPWGNIGLAICYDLRFPELFRHYAEQQAKIIVIPAAFTVPTGRAHWEVLLRARAIENQCFVVAAAQGGVHQNGRETWGHSMIVDPWGTIVGELQQQPEVLVAKIALQQTSELAEKMPVLQHRKL